jgi:hypothetical protein
MWKKTTLERQFLSVFEYQTLRQAQGRQRKTKKGFDRINWIYRISGLRLAQREETTISIEALKAVSRRGRREDQKPTYRNGRPGVIFLPFPSPFLSQGRGISSKSAGEGFLRNRLVRSWMPGLK